MLAASLIAIFFIPMTFDLVERLANRNKLPAAKLPDAETGGAAHD
jgi:hypothetical protein